MSSNVKPLISRVFHTRYNVAPMIKRELSQEDEVDRLSYVDSTTLVKRFIMEGKNLAMSRAHSLYSGINDIPDSDDCLPLPVYAEDPALMAERERLLKSAVDARAIKRARDNADLPSDVQPDSAVGSLSPDGVHGHAGSESDGDVK